MSQTAYFFGRFCLDLRRGALFGAEGQEIPLRPKSFAMLRFFIENAGRLLDQDAIMQAVWPGTIVADEGIVQCVRDIRRSLGDGGQFVIKTVPRRGYIFAADVSPYGEFQRPPAQPGAIEGRPLVAIMPFSHSTLSEEYLAAGFTEELTTALTRIRSLAVQSPFLPDLLLQGAHPSVRSNSPGVNLSAQYAIEGRVRQDGRRVRVNVRLVAALTRTVLWADRYEGDASDAFRLQDDVTDAIAAAVDAYLLADETQKAMSRGLSALDAGGLFLRALVDIQRQTVSSTSDAVALLQRAVLLDPGYGPALAMLAMCQQQQFTQGWRAHHPGAVAETLALTRQALAADPSDPLVLAVAGFVPTWLAGDHEFGAEFATKATVAGAHSVIVLTMTGAVSSICGESEEAISRLERAMRLNPASPLVPRLHTNLAGAHLFAGRYDRAAQLARRALAATPDYTVARLYLTAALALGEDTAAVGHEIARMSARQRSELPHWPGRLHVRHSWMQEMLDEGLRRSGLALDQGVAQSI